jgi:hypothetical protein
MEVAAERQFEGSGNRAVRPFLLSAGLALMWFALFQDPEVSGDLPAWGIAAVLGTRCLVDFVGAWLVVSVLRLAIALGRLGWIRLLASRG